MPDNDPYEQIDLQSKEQREEDKERPWVILGLDLDRQTAEPIAL
jgi:hypothetical protein